MITFVEGILEDVLPTMIVVNAGGIGYQILIPLSSYNKLSAMGSRLRVLTHHHVREDAQILYGFSTSEERDLFRLLLAHVTGVGPKLALAILSGMSVDQFKGAVVTSDIAAISKISGVGKKTDRHAAHIHFRMGGGGRDHVLARGHGRPRGKWHPRRTAALRHSVQQHAVTAHESD
ncbi:MAG: Holliday junction branch migration protein RuvA [Verrucomicrobiota bacterium]